MDTHYYRNHCYRLLWISSTAKCPLQHHCKNNLKKSQQQLFATITNNTWLYSGIQFITLNATVLTTAAMINYFKTSTDFKLGWNLPALLTSTVLLFTILFFKKQSLYRKLSQLQLGLLISIILILCSIGLLSGLLLGLFHITLGSSPLTTPKLFKLLYNFSPALKGQALSLYWWAFSIPIISILFASKTQGLSTREITFSILLLPILLTLFLNLPSVNTPFIFINNAISQHTWLPLTIEIICTIATFFIICKKQSSPISFTTA